MVVTTIRKTRQGRRHRASGGCGSRRVIVLSHKVFREGFSEKVRCAQRPERGEGICCEVARGKGIHRERTASAKILRHGDGYVVKIRRPVRLRVSDGEREEVRPERSVEPVTERMLTLFNLTS